MNIMVNNIDFHNMEQDERTGIVNNTTHDIMFMPCHQNIYIDWRTSEFEISAIHSPQLTNNRHQQQKKPAPWTRFNPNERKKLLFNSKTMASDSTPTTTRPNSRLDTLPPELLRRVFNYAFVNNIEDLEFEAFGKHPVDYGEEDLEALTKDEESSQVVRRLALEQKHRIVSVCLPTETPSAVARLALMATELLGNPGLGEGVRLLHIRLQQFTDYYYEDGDSSDDSESMDLGDGDVDPSVSASASASASASTSVLAGVLDLLRVMPGLTRLVSTMPGLGRVEEEKKETQIDDDNSESEASLLPLILPRLHCLELYETVCYGSAVDNIGYLDLNCTLLRAAPQLETLELYRFNRIGFGVAPQASSLPSPSPSPSFSQSPLSSTPKLHCLKHLVLKTCNIPAASLHDLLGLIGPFLSSVTVDLTRRTCRPSSDADAKNNHMFTTYDLLLALAPWCKTTLTKLTMGRVDMSDSFPVEDVFLENSRNNNENGGSTDRNPPTAMTLLSRFTELAELTVSIDLLDWRTADGSNRKFSVTRTVADALVGQLPPQLSVLTILPALDEGDEFEELDIFSQGEGDDDDDDDDTNTLAPGCWWPRRQALIQSLLEATRAGRFTHLRTITVTNYYGEDTAFYEVPVHPLYGPDGDGTGIRSIELTSDFATRLRDMDPSDRTNVLPDSNV